MTCNNTRSHICDSRYYRRGFTTDEARKVFCDHRRLQRWLDVEATLATVQADLGIIPKSFADELKQTAHLPILDLEAIKSDIERTGHSLIPLLNAWQQETSDQARHFIHYGATTQDIQDTAQSLELRDIFTIVNRDLASIIQILTDLAHKYRDLVMIGRTHGQHALPTTLGLKIAIWLDEMLRHTERLEECRKRVLVSQMFGGVGTMDALGNTGLELLNQFSKRLGLLPATTAWHSARDRQAEFVSVLAMLAGSMAKIANEICQLSRDEIGELEEPFHMGKIGSTTMPHKRNPELCEQVVVLAKLIRANAGLEFDGLINEHERDYRAVRLEWVTITESSLFICGELALMKSILSGLIVHEENIRTNLLNSSSRISTEALMFLLAEKIGKQEAHQLLYDVTIEGRVQTDLLIDRLYSRPEIQAVFSRELLKQTVDPAKHIGLSAQIVDTVVSAAWEKLKTYSTTKYTAPIACPLENEKGSCTVLDKEACS